MGDSYLCGYCGLEFKGSDGERAEAVSRHTDLACKVRLRTQLAAEREAHEKTVAAIGELVEWCGGKPTCGICRGRTEPFHDEHLKGCPLPTLRSLLDQNGERIP